MLKEILLISLFLIPYGVIDNTLGRTGVTVNLPFTNALLDERDYINLDAVTVEVSIFTVNASIFTPTLTEISVEAHQTTVAVTQQEGFKISDYLPSIIIIFLTAAIVILIIKKRSKK